MFSEEMHAVMSKCSLLQLVLSTHSATDIISGDTLQIYKSLTLMKAPTYVPSYSAFQLY